MIYPVVAFASESSQPPLATRIDRMAARHLEMVIQVLLDLLLRPKGLWYLKLGYELFASHYWLLHTARVTQERKSRENESCCHAFYR